MKTYSPWQLLLTYIKPHRLQVTLLWLTLLATLATQLINPQIIGRFLDAAEKGSALAVLLQAAGLFLAIALVEQLLGLATTYLSTNIAWRATNQLREDHGMETAAFPPLERRKTPLQVSYVHLPLSLL